jgi:hypothetical protein
MVACEWRTTAEQRRPVQSRRKFAGTHKNGFPATKLDAKSSYREVGRR